MARNPKGSTPKLTEELIEEIALLLRRGSYIESAAAACGISKDTFYRWLKNGKNDRSNSLQRKLSDAVMISMAEAETRDLEVIDKAALGVQISLQLTMKGNCYLIQKVPHSLKSMAFLLIGELQLGG